MTWEKTFNKIKEKGKEIILEDKEVNQFLIEAIKAINKQKTNQIDSLLKLFVE